MVTITAEVDVDVDLDEFDDDELLDELKKRNLSMQFGDSNENKELIETMYQKYRCGQSIDTELRTFFYNSIGRIA